MKKLFFLAAAITVMASCADEKFLGEDPGTLSENATDGAIMFGLNVPATTRADIYGTEAAKLLGSNFYVVGTKGTEAATSPTPTLVFDNYLVHWGANTANTTESNTANWEYVGVTPGTAPTANYVQLGTYSSQTIKYWDYSTSQYDFFGFSTGTKAAVSSTTPTDEQIGVTKMAYGTSLAGGATAYTLYIPTIAALKETYITDINEVLQTNYGKEVSLKFKNLGSKVRVALYETVPGYSVKDVKFYASTTTPRNSAEVGYAAPTTEATLISADENGFPTKGSIAISFPYIGNDNSTAQAYNKASATVVPTTASSEKTQTYGALTAQYVTGQDAEAGYDGEGNKIATTAIYLGRTLPTASFAGSKTTDFYQTVFPVSTSSAITLRVDYTLVSTDGSKEEIKIYGANAVIPADYTKWQPNYAYTYIFKISDNTNGWTSETATAQGLFPITFDAVVAEATDATAEQKTITTVATPSITTYQQNHDITKDEYSKATAKNIYVRLMNNETLPGSVISGLNAENSCLYELSDATASEAKVMDALQMRTTAVGTVSTADIKGRNGLELTNMKTVISNTATSIINGIDDKPVTGLTSGTLGEITISSLTASKSYAYVYVQAAKTEEINQYEPLSVTSGSPICSTRGEDDFYTLTTANIEGGTTLDAAEAPAKTHLYFAVLKDGTGAVTGYSYISPIGKTTMPVGCKKVLKSVLEGNTTAKGSANATDGTFYFDKYISNDGKYAVKVIKVVD